MIKYILGSKGSGKTRWLIDNANDDMKKGDGNIAFVEVDDDHIFSLDYNVRLINATEYRLNSIESFYGFICGLLDKDMNLVKEFRKVKPDENPQEVLDYVRDNLND